LKNYLYKIPVILAFAAMFMTAKQDLREDFDFRSNNVLKLIQDKIPAAARIEESNFLTKWSKIYDAERKQTGKYILTTPYCDDVKGYAGSVPLIIIADNNEKILGLGVLPNRETPAWIDGLENIKFFDSWNGKNHEEIISTQVDAVTGATFTSRAVKETLKKRSEIFAGRTAYKKAKENSQLTFIDTKTSVVLYIILFLSLVALFVKKLNKYRILIQSMSIIFFGIISGQFLSIYFLENISINGLSILTSYTSIILLAMSVLIPLIFNKHHYCHYICPFGGVQTVLAKLAVKKITVKPEIVRILRYIRLLIFISVLIVVSSSITMNLSLIEPFTVFIFSSASSIVIIGSAVIFISSVFIKNPWCLYLCPTGQFFDLLKDGIRLSSSKNPNQKK